MVRKILLFVACALLAYALVTREAFQTVAAGVAIFLFGMFFLEEGFRALTGGALERVLALSTRSLPRCLLFGFVTTAVMQSSGLVTVITISTLSAALITLAAGIGIIFGANIGTTTGAWLMAGFGMKVDIAAFGMPLIVFGLILHLQKKTELRGLGDILAGMGFVFLGIDYMKNGFSIFSSSLDLSRYAMPGLAGLLVYTLIGLIMTAVMQSSHATLMLTIAALAAGQVTYDNALALAIGSNIGTTVTAVLGALGASVEGRRLAYAHVFFNVVTGAAAIALIDLFKWLVEAITGAMGIAEDNWTMKLATFHTLFNVVGVALMMPFIGRLVVLLERWVKPRERETVRGIVVEPQYLNRSAMAVADAAIEVLLKETRHLLDNVFEVVAHGLNLHRTDILSRRDLAEVVAGADEVMDIDVTQRYYGGVKNLYSAIVEFATRTTAAADMNETQVARVHNIRLACRDAAEIIKLLATVRPNLNRYMRSENRAIREQYNVLRETLAGILRHGFGLGETPSPEAVDAVLKRIEADLRGHDVLADGTLDRLVREGAITPLMATSLMNDSAAAQRIGRELIGIISHLAAAREGTPDELASAPAQ